MRTVLFSVEPIGTKTSSCPVYDGVRPVGLFTVEGVVEVIVIVSNVNKYKNRRQIPPVVVIFMW